MEHLRRDAVDAKGAGRDRSSRVYECFEAVKLDAVADAQAGQLADAMAVVGTQAGGLDVEDGEGGGV